jgi:SAM-dependent methyltransferase
MTICYPVFFSLYIMTISSYLKKVVNFKFGFMQRSFADQPFRLLDVGAGNHSASRITLLFPNCEYYGLDMDKTYNNNEDDFRVMKGFYELDLTKLDFSVIPNDYFDGIWMAHVIEHLPNGDQVLPGLIKKLKPGGVFYIEYPGEKSTTLPSMKGTHTCASLFCIGIDGYFSGEQMYSIKWGYPEKLVLYCLFTIAFSYFTS